MGVTSNSLVHVGVPPSTTDPEIDAVVQWVMLGLESLGQRINVTDELWLHVSYVVPTRPRVGLMVYADGVKWNPGSGEGLYVYKSTGWKFIA